MQTDSTDTDKDRATPGDTDGGLSRRKFLRRGITALGATAVLGSTDWWGKGVREALAQLGTPNGPNDETYWRGVRGQFSFEPDITYLNNGSIGVPPQPVANAVIEGYLKMSANPAVQEYAMIDEIESTVRPQLADFIGADRDEIAFTRNATESLNIMANGLTLKPGDEILTTTHEHSAGLDPWLLKSQRYGVVVRQIRIPSPPESVEQVLESFRSAINDKTRVLFFCHITRGPGLLYPAKALCAMARDRGIISAVDAAQSVGMMEIDVHDMGCDMLASSLHKWMLAPMGTGVLYVRKALQKRLMPLIAGSGTWDISESGSDRYECVGTYPVPLRAGIGAALNFVSGIGFSNIIARNRLMSDHLKTHVADAPGLRLITSPLYELSSPGITTVGVDGWDARSLSRALQERYSISVGSDTADGNNGLRISTHLYNTPREIDKLLDALDGLMQSPM